nr:hypothetical protein Itr_chr07CG10770 [Ipomoea trifida]
MVGALRNLSDGFFDQIHKVITWRMPEGRRSVPEPPGRSSIAHLRDDSSASIGISYRHDQHWFYGCANEDRWMKLWLPKMMVTSDPPP